MIDKHECWRNHQRKRISIFQSGCSPLGVHSGGHMKRRGGNDVSSLESSSNRQDYSLSRRGFIGSAVALPVAGSALAQTLGEWDDDDLDFSWNQDRTELTILIRLKAAVGTTPQAAGQIFEWKLPLWKFGPRAGLALRNNGATDDHEKDYEIRVTRASWGRLTGRPLLFRFIKHRNRDNRFRVYADSGFWSASANPLTVAPFTMGSDPAGGNPDRPASLVMLRDLCQGNESFHQVVNAERVSSTFRLLFNGAVAFTGGSREAHVRLALDHNLDWQVDANPRARMTGLSSRIALQSVKFGWLRDESTNESEARLRLCGNPSDHDGPFDLGSAVAALRIAPTEQAPHNFALEARFVPVDSGSQAAANEYEVRSVGVVSAAVQIIGPPETATGPLGRYLLRLTETIRSPTVPTSADPANQAGLLAVEGWSVGVSPPLIVTPSASLTAEPALQLTPDEEAGRLDRLSRNPFLAVEGAALRARFGWSGARARPRPPARRVELVLRLRSIDIAVDDAAFNSWVFPGGDCWLIHDPVAPLADLPPTFVRLGQGPSDLTARFDLDGARLTVRDDPGVLSLGFRFADMMLALRSQGAPELVALSQTCLGPRATTTDLRPRLAVEFHPQHLLEETLAIPNLPPLPDAVPLVPELAYDPLTGEEPPPGSGRTVTLTQPMAVTEALAGLPHTAARRRLRQRIQEAKSDEGDGPEAVDRRRFKVFAECFQKSVRRKRYLSFLPLRSLPADQAIYIGPYALDPDLMALARALWAQDQQSILNGQLTSLLDRVSALAGSLVQNAGPDGFADALNDPSRALALERHLERNIPRYGELRVLHRERMIDATLDPVTSGEAAGSRLGFELFIFAVVPSVVTSPPAWLGDQGLDLSTMQQQAAATVAFVTQTTTPERMGLMRGRLSGPSRLVFRVNCRDGLLAGQQAATPPAAGSAVETRDLPAPVIGTPRLARRRFDLTLQALTNFADMELSVIDRAETIFKTTASEGRVIDHDPAARFARLGIPEGPVQASRRMAQIIETLRAPSSFETAIELPARLVLSPSQDAVVLTAQAIPDAIFHESPLAHRGGIATRLWEAQFLTFADKGLDPRLRVVHSPDLVPEVLQALDPLPPPPRGSAQYPAMKHPPAWLLGRPMRTPLDAYTRHELVMLSSAWGLPVIGDPTGAGGADNRVAVPDAYRLHDLAEGHSLYVPRSLKTHELALTSMGAFFRHDTPFDPPASARYPGAGDRKLFDAFSIAKWAQTTVLGRDVHVEVHEKGYLFPLGHRCVLVRITERGFFRDMNDPHRRGAIRAYLNQRLLLRILEPAKSYPAVGQPLGGRHFPARLVEFVDRDSPDLVDPVDDQLPGNEMSVSPRGRLNPGGTGKGLVFWPRSAPLTQGNVRFRLRIDRQATELPLIFVNNTAADDEPTMHALASYYQRLPIPETPTMQPDRNEHLRTAVFSPATLRYAPEDREGSTLLATRHWSLSASGQTREPPEWSGTPGHPVSLQNTDYRFDFLLRSVDQPPFYPVLDEAVVDLRQAERLIGRRLGPARVRLDGLFLADGMPPLTRPTSSATQPDSTEVEGSPVALTPGADDVLIPENRRGRRLSANSGQVFINLVDQHAFRMDTGGDRSGGVGRPGGFVVALSRSLGVMTQGSQQPIIDRNPALSALFNDEPETVSPAGRGARALAGPVTFSVPGQNQAASRQGRKPAEIFKSFFGNDATLLGLIKLSDLMEAIAEELDPARDLPQLTETLRMGAGSALQSGDDAVDHVRRNVLVPLSEAVSRIRQEWQSLDAQIAEELSSMPGQVVDSDTLGNLANFAALFPELHVGLTDLDTALRNSTETDGVIAFAATLAQLHSAGKRFLQAIEISARDPVERVTQHLRITLDRFKGELDSLFETITSLPEELLKGIIGDLADIVVGLILPEGQSLPLFRLPPSLTIPGLEADLAPVVEPLLWTYDEARPALRRLLTATSEEEKRLVLRDLQELQSSKVASAKAAAVALAASIDGQIRTRIRNELAALEVLLQSQTDALIDFLFDALDAEILLAREMYRIGGYIRAAIDAKDLRRVLENSRAFLELFTGPLTLPFDSDTICAEIDTVLQPVRLGISALTTAGFQKLTESGTLASILAGTVPADTDTSALANLARLPGRLTVLADRIGPTTSNFGLGRNQPALAEALDQLSRNLPRSSRAVRADLAPLVRELTRASTELATALRNSASVAAAVNSVVAESLAPIVLLDGLAARLSFSSCDLAILRGLKSFPAEIRGFNQARGRALQTLTAQIRTLSASLESLRAAVTGLALVQVRVDQTLSVLAAEIPQNLLDGFQRARSDLADVESSAALQLAQSLAALAGALKDLAEMVHRTVTALQTTYAEQIEDWVVFVGLDESLDQTLSKLYTHRSWLEEVSDRLTRIAAPATLAQVFEAAMPQGSPDLDFAVYVRRVEPGQLSLAQLAQLENWLVRQIARIDRMIQDSLDKVARTGLEHLDALARTVLAQRVEGLTLADIHRTLAVDQRNNLRGLLGNTLADELLVIARDPALDLLSDTVAGDRLDQEQHILELATGSTSGPNPGDAKIDDPLSDAEFRRALGTLLEGWIDGQAAPRQIVTRLEKLVRTFLRGDILQAVDFDMLRSMIERELSRLVPTQIEMDFGFDINMGGDSIKSLTGGVFVPGPDSRLTLAAKTIIDLAEVVRGNPPSVTFNAEGKIGPFEVRLIGDAFDAVTLTFAGVNFKAEKGNSPRMKADLTDVTLGEKLAFLQQLSAILSPGNESGPFIEIVSSPIGIKAGYRLFIGDFSIGAIAFFNIRLEAALLLPFGEDPALMSVALSSRENPFTISYLPYGGSGFLALQADSEGLRSIEASFEFGGAAAFAFGPLSGIGRLMSGIYIRSVRLPEIGVRTEIWATFYVGGSAKLWIFSFEASLYVRLGMVQGNMVGEAVFTYGFSIGLKRFRFRVRVQRGMKKGFEENQSGRVGNQASYRGSVQFAQSGGGPALGNGGAQIRNLAKGPDRHWQIYRSYFDPFAPPSEVLA